MYLIFDTSYLGKQFNPKAPYTDVFNWPRMIHLSWILLDNDFKPIEDYDCIIKPEGYSISESVAEKHHVTQEDAEQNGEKLKDVLINFQASLDKAQYVFAHNLAINESVLGAEFIRKSMKNELAYAEKYCLMQESTYFCKLKGKGGNRYKWPSLSELHAIIFKQKYTPTNNARADVIAASRCFIALMKIGALEDIF